MTQPKTSLAYLRIESLGLRKLCLNCEENTTNS